MCVCVCVCVCVLEDKELSLPDDIADTPLEWDGHLNRVSVCVHACVCACVCVCADE